MREFSIRTAILLAIICIYIIITVDGKWHDSGIGALLVPIVLVPPAAILNAITLYPAEKWIRRHSRLASLIIVPFISSFIMMMILALLTHDVDGFINGAKVFSLIGLGWGVLWTVTGITYIFILSLIRSLSASKLPS
jgi:hypothetical protein